MLKGNTGQVLAAGDVAVMPRQRINQALAQCATAPLVLLEAPAGYGKTLAMREFLAHQQAHTIWLTLTERDHEPTQFYRHLCESFWQKGFALGDLAEPVFSKNYPGLWSMENRVAALAQDQPLHIVLDDYHLVNNRRIDGFVEELIRQRIANVHLYILTRTRPELSMTDLLLKNLLRVLTATDLCFTREELADYLRKLNLWQSDDQLERMYRRTEGWIAAVRLLALQSGGQEDSLPRLPVIEGIDNLFEKEIYSRLQPAEQVFLQAISVLNEFPPAACAAVSACADAPRIMARLAKNSLFIRYDQTKQEYVLHQLFLEFLRQQSRKMDGEKRRELYLRAGDYYAGEHKYVKALHFYAETEAYEEMVVAIQLFLQQGQQATRSEDEALIAYIQKMPQTYLNNNPILGLCLALCYMATNDYLACRNLVADLRKRFPQGAAGSLEEQENLLGELEFVLGLLEFNNLERMMAYFKRAGRFLPNGSKFINNTTPITYGAYSMLFLYHDLPGKLDARLELLQANHDMMQRLLSGGAAGLYELVTAERAYLRADLDEAERLAERAAWLAGYNKQAAVRLAALHILLCVAMLRGEYERCEVMLARLEQTVELAGLPIYETTRDMCRTNFFVAVEAFERLPAWVRNCNTETTHSLSGAIVLEHVTCTRAMVAQKQFYKVESLVCQVECVSQAHHFVQGKIYAAIYRAIAACQTGQPEQAAKALRQAYELAQPDGLISMFLEESVQLAPLFQKLLTLERETAYAAWLRQMLPQLKNAQRKSIRLRSAYRAAMLPQQGVDTATKLAVKLSRREREVLGYMSEGLTGKEMAARMAVSLNNVKGITTRLYNKLAVSNKTEAVYVARNLEIL